MNKTIIVGLAIASVLAAGAAVAQTPRFTRDTSTANQPTVLDNKTGLEWQGCARGLTGNTCGTGSATTLTWQEALGYCEGLSWGGHTDWRLPSINELSSLVDHRRTSQPSIDIEAFPATPNNVFWSSSSRAWSASPAWIVSFDYGLLDYNGKASAVFVRCVRSGL